jgi:hypothetical protein
MEKFLSTGAPSRAGDGVEFLIKPVATGSAGDREQG